MFTRPDAPDKLETKGLQLVRRDSCPLVREASSAVLDAMMFERDAALATDVARSYVADLLRGRVPMESLVVSKALRSGYKNDQQPHLVVARKLERRRGQPVASGERVPFVYVKDPGATSLSQKAEDPAHVREHGLQLDVLHYLEHQLQQPLFQLLELVVDDPARALLDTDDIKPLLAAARLADAGEKREAKRVRVNLVNRQSEITRFFSKASGAPP